MENEADPLSEIEQLLTKAQEADKTELDKVIAHIFKPENLRHVSDLSDIEIAKLVGSTSLARKYGLQVVLEDNLEFLALRVSKTRKGRKEFVDLVTRKMEHDEFREGRFGRVMRDEYRRPPR